MEAILLAGGLGTRLHKVTGDRYPKSLAEVNGHPFIHYIVKYLQSMGVKRFVFAVSHHAEMIVESINSTFPSLDVDFSFENEPLGTGGAIKQAMTHIQGESALVVNSDSFMEFSLESFIGFAQNHFTNSTVAQNQQAQLAIICTKVDDISRFGAADISDEEVLQQFFEKGRTGSGYINSGIYLLNKEHPLLNKLSGKFSFENEVLANSEYPVFAYKNSGLFFDIGTPDDFAGAQALVENHGHLFLTND
ncbi:MAG: hypothetical protein CL811_12125 [Colwelliaceae bacterium]|nr:hypothetical protein [Colwelliaceae bacterium]